MNLNLNLCVGKNGENSENNEALLSKNIYETKMKNKSGNERPNGSRARSRGAANNMSRMRQKANAGFQKRTLEHLPLDLSSHPQTIKSMKMNSIDTAITTSQDSLTNKI